jgi:aminoglycoside phosphotransferase (APT) family kinase protein
MNEHAETNVNKRTQEAEQRKAETRAPESPELDRVVDYYTKKRGVILGHLREAYSRLNAAMIDAGGDFGAMKSDILALLSIYSRRVNSLTEHAYDVTELIEEVKRIGRSHGIKHPTPSR